MDYQKASEYWKKKDEKYVVLEKEELYKRIEEFILSHNTLALATGYMDEVRCTPVEYNYDNHAFYIFSEGGEKFRYLEKNKNVSASIFDSYQGFEKIHSLQITGKASIIEEEDEEFSFACEKKGLNMAAIRKMDAEFHLIKITPSKYEFLDSDLKKEGYSNRQKYVF